MTCAAARGRQRRASSCSASAATRWSTPGILDGDFVVVRPQDTAARRRDRRRARGGGGDGQALLQGGRPRPPAAREHDDGTDPHARRQHRRARGGRVQKGGVAMTSAARVRHPARSAVAGEDMREGAAHRREPFPRTWTARARASRDARRPAVRDVGGADRRDRRHGVPGVRRRARAALVGRRRRGGRALPRLRQRAELSARRRGAASRSDSLRPHVRRRSTRGAAPARAGVDAGAPAARRGAVGGARRRRLPLHRHPPATPSR